MKLSTYLLEKLMYTDIEANSIDEAIEIIIDKVANADKLINSIKEEAKKSVLKREHEIPTAIGNGFVVPHARLQGYDDVLVAFVKLTKPIEYEIAALHKKDEIKYMVLIIAGKTKNKLMLKLMASVSKLAMKKEFQSELGTNSVAEVLKLVKKYESEVKDKITAEDIMEKSIEPIGFNKKLEEVATRLVCDNLGGIPVLDDFGNFAGEITARELIEFGMPKYASLFQDLSFMAIGEPFEDYFKNESTVKVNELYRENVMTVERKTGIMEISYLMVTKGNTRIYVVEDGKYYGMIERKDIIKKVLHI
jgi:PTS system nitrogen regulatory IIA component